MVKVFCIIGPLEAERHAFEKYENVLGVFFVSRFYSPVNSMGSCRALSVYLITLL